MYNVYYSKEGVTTEFINHQDYCFYRTLGLVGPLGCLFWDRQLVLQVGGSQVSLCILQTHGRVISYFLPQSEPACGVWHSSLSFWPHLWLSLTGNTGTVVVMVVVDICLSLSICRKPPPAGLRWFGLRVFSFSFCFKGAGSHLSAERETPGETTEQVPDCWVSECLSPSLASCCAGWWGWWWW